MTASPPEMTDDTKLMMARAFDTAWACFLDREGANGDTEDNRRRLARRIVAVVKSGNLDEEELAESGLIYLSVLAEAARLHNTQQPAATDASPEMPPASETPHAFGPDGIAAMRTALDLCLDELPLQISSDVVTFLTRTILDEATRGEQDPARLSEAALSALKSR